ncbi:hypothetical protein BDR22DRAFT_970770 [Usnea florida]
MQLPATLSLALFSSLTQCIPHSFSAVDPQALTLVKNSSITPRVPPPDFTPVTPFRYFKLQNQAWAIIVRRVMDSNGDYVLWEGGPSISVGDAHWTDLATETDANIVSGNDYKFGARVRGAAPNEWDPTAYPVDFGSSLEAEFVYDGSEVYLNSIYEH